MKTYVKHLIRHHLDEIVEKSLLHCHVMGMHSIMLHECGEKTMRLYIAEEGNELYKNSRQRLIDGDQLSLAYHGHHSDLTLEGIKGTMQNITIIKAPKTHNYSFAVEKFEYQSAILKEESSFKHIGEEYFISNEAGVENLNKGKSIEMKANVIHTVVADRNKLTAWMVYEGKKNKDYQSHCYSPRNPKNTMSNQMYQPMTSYDVIHLLKRVNLID